VKERYMPISRCVSQIVLIGAAVLSAGMVLGQNFPTKNIRFVTAPPGTGSDFTTRLIAPGISGSLGQPVIVDNRPTGVTPGQVVMQASPDGHTLLMTGANHWIGTLFGKTPYDPVMDFFSPITVATIEPNLLVVTPSLPVNSVKELIALAKAKPGALNYAATSVGGGSFLAAELFKSMAGVNIVSVPYSSGSGALADLLSGQVQVFFQGGAAMSPYVKSGKLRALGIASAQPSPLFPGMPTVASSLPGFESVSVQAVLAPAKTPQATIRRLNSEIARALNNADVKEKLFNTGLEVVGSSPEQLAALIKSDLATVSKLIKETGIKVDK
jgi:tripartite-type tricarboxylate transporter receptor subunit TctC